MCFTRVLLPPHMQYVRAPPGDRSRWAGELSNTTQSSPNDRRAANEILHKPPGITSLHDHKRGGLDSRHKRFKACSTLQKPLEPVVLGQRSFCSPLSPPLFLWIRGAWASIVLPVLVCRTIELFLPLGETKHRVPVSKPLR